MFRRRRRDSDFAAEIQSHLEIAEDALREQGASAQEARAAARRAFGNATAAQERFYESRRWLWWDHLRQDMRFAARALARSPGFAAAAILTLSLGIGANTAIFSAADDALLRPFPLPNADELVQVYSFDRSTNLFVSTSYPDYEDFRSRSRSFLQLSAYVRLPLNITIGADTGVFAVEGVTDNYFAMIEVPALSGRTLGVEDDQPGAPPVAMIGEKFWRERFHANSAIVGKPIYIEDRPFRIVGIVPRRYAGINLNWDEPPQIWIPIHAVPLVVPGFGAADVFHRRVQFVPVAGRLRPGISRAHAEAELQAIAAALARSDPATNRNLTAFVYDLSRSKFWPSWRGTVRLSLMVLMTAAGLVLLLGCANISNLLLQRALDRGREFAVRLAIGARRSRLIGQLMIESVLLVVPGFGLALIVSQALSHILLSLPGAFGLGLTLDLSLESRALAFSAAISLGAALVFGLAPALQATRGDVWPSLKEPTGAPAPSRRAWTRHSLVVMQIAFCFILLVGSGLFARTLLKASSIDLGFRPRNLLLVNYNFPQSQIPSAERVRSFKQEIVRGLSGIPGIESAALADSMLTSMRRAISIAGAPAVQFSYVGPSFFPTAGIPVLRGREFNPIDQPESPRVALVNHTLARLLDPNGDVVGRVVKLSQGPPAQIVGVVGDSKYHSVWDLPRPYLYLDMLQFSSPGSTAIVRTRGRPESVIPAIRREWDRIAPGVPLLEIHTGEDQVNRSLAPQRAAAALLAGFALLAVVLASVGLFAAMAYSVAQRTREIGIRIAIGAQPQSVVRQVFSRAFGLIGIGIALGAAISLAAMRLLASQIQGVAPNDPITFSAVTLLVIAVSAAAVWAPARRAARIDPVKTLRWD